MFNKFPSGAEVGGRRTSFENSWDSLTTLHLYLAIYNSQGAVRYINMMYLNIA